VVGPERLEGPRCLGDRARRIDHVIGDETIPIGDLAHHVQHFGDIRRGAALVDDREGGVEPLREPSGHLRRSDVGSDDHEVLQLLLAVVRREHRRRVEVIDGDVEEPLQLVLVEVQPEDTIDAGGLDEIRDQLGADGHARLILAVLSCIPVVGQHTGDAGRRRATGCIDQQQQLDQVLGRRVGGLDDEDIVAANVLVDPHEDLTVRKAGQCDLAEIGAEASGDLLGEPAIGGTRDDLEARPARVPVHFRRSLET
jgi:hypothetical protein